ncbi:SAM-dependent DNA methyltransferase [Lactobacillus mulieris]|uniref:SAM-dependent DNA methyltransferase n=2 Tax=Lactobacillaceae TaxID=33958 RepID=UPI0022CDE617|nr:SAM-dependent DNA methyltransferase [Lactobacillus mulieris]MCZ9718676.1 SAM-dependent DNA methyltransferase [Lactobacillus mulieris]
MRYLHWFYFLWRCNTNMISKDQFWKIAGVTQHIQFENYLREIIFNPEKRNNFFKQLLKLDAQCVVQDTFKQYFEEYAAERKANQQDYTPDEVSQLLSIIVNTKYDADFKNGIEKRYFHKKGYTAADITAGTGSLLIQKWWADMTAELPWTYVPHRYFYFASELADNVIPYLLCNLALRGMNAIVVHGDALTGETKQVYFIQNSKDDYLSFSDINVMPHSKQVTEEFNVTKWLEEAIDHIESKKIIRRKDYGPMLKRALHMQIGGVSKPFIPPSENQMLLGRFATIERAKAKKVYPKGTVVIQISATRGQCGMLTSSGEVGSQYACIQFKPYIDSFTGWMKVKQEIPRWRHKYQEGLNIKLEDIGKIPFNIPINWLLPFEEQQRLKEERGYV